MTARARSAVDGEFITEAQAEADPTHTVVEHDGPRETGFCHTAGCHRRGVEVSLFKPVGEVPVLCQCGELLHDEAEPADGPAEHVES